MRAAATAGAARRYIGLAAATALVVCAATALLNAIVDPFGTTRLVEAPGFNAYKPAMYNRVRLAKAYDIRRLQPLALVLGTSRSHVALRPAHEGWDPSAEPRYNLGFDGATTEEIYRYLLHARVVAPVRQVVLGLDTWQLGHDRSMVRPDFDPSILYEPGATVHALAVPLADLRLLLSLTTLQASLRTLAIQGDAQPEWLARDGQRRGDVFFHRAGEEFMTEGPGAYFAAIDRQEIGFKLDTSAPPRARRLRTPAPEASLMSFDYIRRIVEFCHAEDIDLRIFITPAHAHQMEISAVVGEWPKIEQGKRDLVRLLADDAARSAGRRPIPLWDFSGYSSVTTEPVPPPGSTTEMKFYWDSSHFKEVVGDFVLDRVFGVSGPERPVPADFGVLLTSDTIDMALAEIRADGERYRREHAADLAAIWTAVAEARGEGAAGTSTRTARLP